MFSKRRIEPEELDHLPPELARPNLADLTRINKRFGGHSTLQKTLASVSPPDSFTLLDVGAASGDSAERICDWYPQARVTSLDLHPTNLERAAHPKVLADAFALPFREASFDYVLCSLFLHHFTDQQCIALLQNLYAVASRTLLVCDLERSLWPFLFLPATRRIFHWNPVTVGDGMKSVRAAFRAKELTTLAQMANIKGPEVRTYHPAFRLALIARKHE